VIRPELLDHLEPEQARASLGDLIRLNRVWGGHSTLRRLAANTLPRDETFSVLDVGAASGDMGTCLRQWYPGAHVVSLDYRASHMLTCPGDRVTADAFRLPFKAHSFDYVFCSLFLHHFTDPQVIELLRGFGAAARRRVLVIDLERHPVPYYFVPWTRWLFGWDRVTAHDAPASVAAAFQPRELEDLARRAGLREPRARAFRPAFRIAMRADVA
jgi:hypothetical protein